MYPTTTAFRSKIRQPHRVITKAEVWTNNQRLVTLDVIDGSVDVDARRATRRTCDLTLVTQPPVTTQTPVYNTYSEVAASAASYTALAAKYSSYSELLVIVSYTTTTTADSLIPDNAFDALTPFGNELRVWRGIVTEDGDEYIPEGVFGIEEVEIHDSKEGLKVFLKGSDRSKKISRARWTSPYHIASGTNVVDAITGILSSRLADVQTNFVSSTATVSKVVLGTDANNDPWKDAVKIAESAGLELYFDGDGVATLRTARDYSNASPDAIYRENEEAMVLNVSRRLTNDRTYNGAIVSGEGTFGSSVIRVEAWDDDPESPTYRYGNFGQVPQFLASPLITTSDQAQAAANAMLSKSKGVVESVLWSQIVDPSLDAGDVVAVYNAATKLQRLLVVDKLSIPLSVSQAMSSVARTIRSLSGETFLEESSS